MDSDKERQFWHTQEAGCPPGSSWVPLSIRMKLNEEHGLSISEVGQEEEDHGNGGIEPCSANRVSREVVACEYTLWG